MSVVRKSKFDRFFENREALIIQFKMGDMTKREYLETSFNFITALDLKPFKKIDNFKKGMFNYQYYNMLAKYNYMRALDIKNGGKHPELYKQLIDKTNFFYHKKDQATAALLEIVEYRNVEAYYIKVRSGYLKDRLYEIVLKDYENTVFHSRSKWLMDILIREKIFLEGTRRSVIDDYINERY